VVSDDDGPALWITGADVGVAARQLEEAIYRGWLQRRQPPPDFLLNLAIRAHQRARGSASSGPSSRPAASAEPRNSRRKPDGALSGQPVKTLSVKEAAQAAACSESYVRRLVRDKILEVRDSRRPPYEIYADSFAAWQERRRRDDSSDPKAA